MFVFIIKNIFLLLEEIISALQVLASNCNNSFKWQKICFLSCPYCSRNENNNDLENFCVDLDLLRSNINQQLPIWSIVTGDFNARCSNVVETLFHKFNRSWNWRANNKSRVQKNYWQTQSRYHCTKQIFQIHGKKQTQFLFIGLQLVKSLVIVIYFFGTEMRDAAIINYRFIVTLRGKAVAKL